MGSFECPARNGGCTSWRTAPFFEIVDTETEAPVPNGTIGNMVCTILHRRVMPMIRFNLRDPDQDRRDRPLFLRQLLPPHAEDAGRSDTMVCAFRGVSIWPQACLPAIKSDARTTGEWLCIAERHERDGVVRDEMTCEGGSSRRCRRLGRRSRSTSRSGFTLTSAS